MTVNSENNLASPLEGMLEPSHDATGELVRSSYNPIEDADFRPTLFSQTPAAPEVRPDSYYTNPYRPRRRTSMAQAEAMNQASLDEMDGPIGEEEFWGAWKTSRTMKKEEAHRLLRSAAMRLPDDLREQLPPEIAGRGTSMEEQWAFLQTHPDTKAMMERPEFINFFGDRIKQIGTLEKIYYSLPLTSVWLGMKRGSRNFLYGRTGYVQHLAGGSFGDTEFQAEMARQAAQRAEDAAFLNALEYDTWAPINWIRDFQINFGDTAGGMATAAAMPESLTGAALGGLAGLAGGPGALATAGGGWLTGMSLAQSASAGWANAWELYDAMPEEAKDEALAIQAAILTTLPSFVLERLGVGFMLKGAGPSIRGATGSVMRGLAPSVTERLTRAMASKTYKGVAARFMANAAYHTVPEVITEGLQEGPVEVGARMWAADRYNQIYGRKGYVLPVPTAEELLEAAWAGAWQAAWGGAGVGLIAPAAELKRDAARVREGARDEETRTRITENLTKLAGQIEEFKNMSPEQQTEFITRATEAAMGRLDLNLINRANEDLRKGVKAATEQLRAIPEAEMDPALTEEAVLKSFGEPQAYVNAKALQSLFQTALENEPGLAMDDIQAGFLDQLGISADQFAEALDDNTDVMVDLTSIPRVMNDPMWDRVTDLMTLEPESITKELLTALESLPPAPIPLERADANVSDEARAEVEKGLLAAGRTKGQAKRETLVLTRMAGTLARITGVKPDIILGRLQFERGGPGQNGGDSLALHQPPFLLAEDQNVVFRSGMKDLPPVMVTKLTVDPATANRTKATATAKSLRGSVISNQDLGGEITITRRGANEGLSHKPSAETFASFNVLTDLIERAQWVRNEPDMVPGKAAKQFIHAYAPVSVDGRPFVAHISLRHWGENKYEYYGHNLEAVKGPAPQSSLSIQADPSGNLSSLTNPSEVILIDWLGNVKRPGSRLPSDMTSLYQGQEQQGKARGRTDILSQGNYLVVFSPEADASTAIHEFQHVFVDMAQNILTLPLDQIADMEARNQLEADMKVMEAEFGVKDGQWTVEAHEKAAEAFERYFMEGKAPVKSLQGIFSRMKQYLLKLYEGFMSMNRPLSDDLRRVFDRQLATEEELALESGRNDSALDAAVLDFIHEVDPKLYDEYAETANRAQEEQEREIIEFRNAEREKAIGRWKREGRKMAREDSRQMRLAEIKKRGISAESFEACGYDSTAIQAFQKRHPGLISKTSRVGLDEMASEFGLTADDFFQELINTPTIEEMAAAYAAEQEAFFAEEGYFDSLAPLTDAGVDLAEMELKIWAKYMAEHGSKYAPKSSREIQRHIDRTNKIKNADEIYAKDMADLRANYRAQIRAAKAARLEGIDEGRAGGYKSGVTEGYRAGQALAKADLLQQRLELAVRFRDQTLRQRDRQKAMAEFKRVSQQNTARQFKFGGILPSYHSQIKALLHQFGIGPEVQSEMSLADFIAQEKDQNAGIGAADWIVNGQWPAYGSGKRAGRRIPLQSLSDGQFNDVKQAVANLTFLGRRQQKVLVGGQLQDLNRVVEELEIAAKANRDIKTPRTEQEIFEDTRSRNKFGGALFGFIDGFSAALLKTETICRVLDGGEYGGFWQQTIYEPINKAHHDTIARTKKLTDDVSALIESRIGKKQMMKWRGNKVVIEGVPWTFTQEQLFMYIMHLGNAQNTRLARNFDLNGDGKGVNEAQHKAIMDAASQEMWDLAQAFWDYQDHTMFPELDALTLRTTGLPLKKVEAEPVMTRYGQYRGGYAPIVFDRRMGETAERLNAKRDSAQAAANRYQPGKTNASATTERSGFSYNGLRASLSLGALANSWAENIYDLSYREATNDVKRLLANPQIRQTISGAFSDQHLRQFDLWIQEMIAPGSERKSTIAGVDAALKAVRRNITTSAMGLKASVMLCQPSGIFQAMHKIGPINTTIGITSFFTSLMTGGRPFLDQLYQKSPELGARNATGSHDRDISDSMSMRNPLRQTMRDKLDVVAFKPIAVMDQLTANSVWTGAYLDSKSKGKTEAEAVEYANSVVRTTQSTGAAKDLSYVQRGMGYGDLGKIFTMFGTFFSASHNLFWEQYKLIGTDLKKGQYGRAAKGAGSAFLYLALLPAIYDALMRDGLPEDDEDWENMGKGATSYFVGGIPVVKDLVSRALGTSFRFQPAPILGTLDDMTVGLGEGMQKIAAGEENGWTKTIRGLGGWTGLPTGQITTTMKGVEEWPEREGIDALYRLLVRESPK